MIEHFYIISIPSNVEFGYIKNFNEFLHPEVEKIVKLLGWEEYELTEHPTQYFNNDNVPYDSVKLKKIT